MTSRKKIIQLKRKVKYNQTLLRIAIIMAITAIIVGIITIISLIDIALNYREKEIVYIENVRIVAEKQNDMPIYSRPHKVNEQEILVKYLPIYDEEKEKEEQIRENANANVYADVVAEYDKKVDKIVHSQNRGFVFINTQINGWTLDWDTQKHCWDRAGGNLFFYLFYQALAYKEGVKNNYTYIHYNDNGSKDYGIAQINEVNIIFTKKYNNKVADMTVCFKPRESIFIMGDIVDYNIGICGGGSLYEAAMAYNGGYGVIEKVRTGEWTHNCVSGKYAKDVFRFIDQLYEAYNEVKI